DHDHRWRRRAFPVRPPEARVVAGSRGRHPAPVQLGSRRCPGRDDALSRGAGMTAVVRELERQCGELLKEHVREADEQTLHRAYELGRRALARGVGVMDMAATLWSAILEVGAGAIDRDPGVEQRIEAFVLESMSPFEMTHRGVREANLALRQFETRREEEARRIARELHDEAGQLLATVYFALESMRGDVTPTGEAQLARVFELLHHVE